MSGRHFTCDTKQFQEFFDKLNQAAQGAFKEELATWLDAVGYDFLRVVEDEIISRKVMDTRLLLNSFHKGAQDNVFLLDADGLTLEVGTNVEYAEWVEYGHAQQPGRFVPGYWSGDRFVYEKGAKTGMVLKASYVPGKHYFEGALKIYDKLFQASLEKKMDSWLEKYFA